MVYMDKRPVSTGRFLLKIVDIFQFSPMPNILIADTQSVMRLGLRHILNEHFESAQIYDTDTINGLLAIIKIYQIDIILMAPDTMIPDQKAVIELIFSLKSGSRVIIFSEHPEVLYAPMYLKSGASAYLQKNIGQQELITCVKSVLRGDIYFGKKLQNFYFSRLNNENPFSMLTQREEEVLDHILKGKRTCDISRLMNVKNTTISSYKTKIFIKLGIRSMSELFSMVRLYK